MRTASALTLVFALLSTAAAVADTPVSQQEITRMITGRSVAIGTDSAYYGADGTYSYNNANPGKYRVQAGRICVDFANGAARCDRIVRDGGNYYLITASGARFQFRP